MSLSEVGANSNICIFRLFQDLLPAGRRQTWRHHHVATVAGLDLKCAATACMTPFVPSRKRKTEIPLEKAQNTGHEPLQSV